MIQLINCGYQYVHKDGIKINRPSGCGNYAFVFFRSASEIVLNGNPIAVGKHTYILIGPHTSHMYRDLERPFVNDWFHCTGDGLEEFLSQLKFPVDTPLQAPDPLLITKCIMDLHNTIRQGSPLQDRIVDCDLKSFFMKLLTLQSKTTAAPDQTSRYFVPFSKLRSELYSSPHASYSVASLAAGLNLSKSYFQHIYKELFGCSVIADIINGRLEYAKYLLDNSSLSIAAISRMCGYENDTHFMRQFKKYVGVTPSRYKVGS